MDRHFEQRKRDDRRAGIALCVVLGAVTLALSVFFLFAPIRQVVAHIPDDAFYFFKTAQNMAAGKGMTFDGINPTNGFQPLWLWLLVPWFTVFDASPETMTRVIMMFQVSLGAGMSLALFAALRRAYTAGTTLVCGSLFSFWVMASCCYGMESPVLIATIMAAAYYAYRFSICSSLNWAQILGFGGLLGLVMLARLDHVFVVLSTMLTMVLISYHRRERWTKGLRRLLLTVSGILLIVGPYLLYNAIHFESIIPISGLLKSTFPRVGFTWDAFFQLTRAKQTVAVFLLAYLIWFGLTIRGLSRSSVFRRAFRIFLATLGFGLLLHLINTLLFMDWAVEGWYFIAYNLFFVLVLGEVWEVAFANNRWGALRQAHWLLLIAILYTGGTRLYRNFTIRLDTSPFVLFYEAGTWIREHSSPEDRYAMSDTGILGFFAERQVVNLDGLVNTMEYQRALRDQRLNRYLRDQRIGYLCYWTIHDYERLAGNYQKYRIRYWSRYYRSFSEEVVVRQEDEVYRSSTYRYGEAATGKPFNIVIWRLDDLESSENS